MTVEQTALWETLDELFGPARLASSRAFRAKMVYAFDSGGYTPSEIQLAAKEYRREWPRMTLTAPALFKWADEFLARSRPVKRAEPVVEPEAELVGPPPGWSLPRLREI